MQLNDHKENGDGQQPGRLFGTVCRHDGEMLRLSRNRGKGTRVCQLHTGEFSSTGQLLVGAVLL
ncbi:Rieske 2Fe-2S domain-containing protein [Chitinimonas sp. PSY-7]|uniref:Rieske 2Fe-2S domain-containing protein n=1 Tax=Chitinimonas sp. PSY-7 TaxID=3459088 RepID=UPI0040403D02